VNFIRNEPFERQPVTSFACGTRAILRPRRSRISSFRRTLSNNPLRDSLPANLSTLRHNCTHGGTHARTSGYVKSGNETHYAYIRDSKAMQIIISSFLPQIRHSVSSKKLRLTETIGSWLSRSRFRFSSVLKFVASTAFLILFLFNRALIE